MARYFKRVSYSDLKKVQVLVSLFRKLPIFVSNVSLIRFSKCCLHGRIQKYDCLYNKSSKDYKNKYKKLDCLSKIGRKFDLDPAEAETRNLRTSVKS